MNNIGNIVKVRPFATGFIKKQLNIENIIENNSVKIIGNIIAIIIEEYIVKYHGNLFTQKKRKEFTIFANNKIYHNVIPNNLIKIK